MKFNKCLVFRHLHETKSSHINPQRVVFILKRASQLYNISNSRHLICRSYNNFISNCTRYPDDLSHKSNTTVVPAFKICVDQMTSEKEAIANNSLESKTDFDMAKIVQDVKNKIQEKRKQKKAGKKNEFEKSFGLEMLFADGQSSCDEQYQTMEIGLPNISHVKSPGLQQFYEEAETVIRRNKKKRKRKKQKQNDIDHFGLKRLFSEKIEKREPKNAKNASECEDDKKTKIKKKKPNYFISIRVSDPQIHANAKKFQESIVKENKKLQEALIPLPSLHLTMALMHIEDKTLIEAIENALEKCKADIIDLLETIDFKIKFVGIGDFRKQVLFVKVQEENIDCLRNINNILTCSLQDFGIVVVDENDWKAHLTLLKLSRCRSRIKKVDKEIYSSWIDSYFGEEQISNISLCSMFEPKDEDGYYKCVVNIILNRSDISQGEILKTGNENNN